MTHAAIIEEMVLASASMDVARDAAERGDWSKAEQPFSTCRNGQPAFCANWDCRAGPQSHPTSRLALRRREARG